MPAPTVGFSVKAGTGGSSFRRSSLGSASAERLAATEPATSLAPMGMERV